MQITAIENFSKIRNKIFLDGEFAFILYNRDLRLYELEEGSELSEEKYEKIMKETIVRRAKLKTMELLKNSDKTAGELERKLRSCNYPDRAVSEAIAYVESFGYIDDLRYAESYIRTCRESRSRKEIEHKLSEKGISKETISAAYDNLEEEKELFKGKALTLTSDDSEDPEVLALRKTIRKKLAGRQVEELDRDGLKKLTAFLLRKGFKYSDIRKELKNSSDSFDGFQEYEP